jgi:AcrR family transcriptional regulator
MVAVDPTTLHLVGDEDSSKRRQILDGARKVFMDLGFDGASMGEIARSAGVSKGTLYVYFADKNRLFEAIVEEEAFEQGKVAFNFDPERDVATTLRQFGQAYIELLCRPGGGSAIRTVMAIAERMPEVGRRFYERVLESRINRLADYLEAHVKAKELAIDNCKLAAEQFMLTCQASLFPPFIFQAAPPPSAERIAQVVESATRMFLAAYQARPDLAQPPAPSTVS